jgi:hypothetical protein
MVEPNTESALPGTYYAVFGVIEPTLMALGFLLFTLDRESSIPDQAHPASPLLLHHIYPAAYVAFFQPGYIYLLAALVEASIAFFIYSRLSPIRGGMRKDHMKRVLTLQEGACKALLMALAIGDVGAIAVPFYALGWETMKNVREWSIIMWCLVGLSVSFALPRWAWFVGLGRWSSSSSVETH